VRGGLNRSMVYKPGVEHLGRRAREGPRRRSTSSAFSGACIARWLDSMDPAAQRSERRWRVRRVMDARANRASDVRSSRRLPAEVEFDDETGRENDKGPRAARVAAIAEAVR
jgi:hypothetical protein